MEEIRLSVLDFTEYPGPRYIRQDLDNEMTSGEAFYVQVLNKTFAECFKNKKKLILVLDGVSGYPSSFLDEAIGELVFDFTLDVVKSILDFDTRMYKKRVQQVKEETYCQWEERRKKGDSVSHSSNINKNIYFLNSVGEIEEKHLQ